MTDYSWPASVIPSASEWRLVANTASFTSPLSGTTRTLGRGGDRWACTLSFEVLNRADAAQLRALLAKLRGQTHRVLVPDHSYVRRGALTSNFLVNGGSQSGSSLVCDGASNSTTNAMREGDWIKVGSYLYMITADANTNASGQTTLSISPPLRSSPADNATVEIVAPTCRMMLSEQTVGWQNAAGGFAAFEIEFTEDLAP